MVNLNLIQNGSINHLVLKFILENEDEEFLYRLIPEPIGYKTEVGENGTLYHIDLTDKLWVKILQDGNNYSLVSCS